MKLFSFVLLLAALSACSDTSCNSFRPENYDSIVSGEANALLLSYIGGENFNQRTSVDELQKALEDVRSDFYSVNQSCIDSQHLYFNVHIKEHEHLGLKGFIALQSGKFHRGPFLVTEESANVEAVFIQADRNFKKQ